VTKESRKLSAKVSIDREFAVSHETTQNVVVEVERLFDEAKAAFVERIFEERRKAAPAAKRRRSSSAASNRSRR
jgi:hypothetical protein